MNFIALIVVFYSTLIVCHMLDLKPYNSGSYTRIDNQVYYIAQQNKDNNNEDINNIVLKLDLKAGMAVDQSNWTVVYNDKRNTNLINPVSVSINNSKILNLSINQQVIVDYFNIKDNKWDHDSNGNELSTKFNQVLNLNKNEQIDGYTLTQNDINKEELFYIGSSYNKETEQFNNCKIINYNLRSKQLIDIKRNLVNLKNHITISNQGKIFNLLGMVDNKDLNPQIIIIDTKSKTIDEKSSTKGPTNLKYTYFNKNELIYVIGHDDINNNNSDIYIFNTNNLEWDKKQIEGFKSLNQGHLSLFEDHLIFYSFDNDKGSIISQFINIKNWELVQDIPISNIKDTPIKDNALGNNNNNNTNTNDSSNNINVGALVGGLIGGMLFIIILCFILFYMFYYKKRINNNKNSCVHDKTIHSKQVLVMEESNNIVLLPDSFDNSILNCSYSTIDTFNTSLSQPFGSKDNFPLPKAYLTQNIN